MRFTYLCGITAVGLLTACGQGADETPADDVRTVEKTEVDVDGTDDNALVTISVTGVDPSGGPIYIALQDTTNFAQTAALRTIRSEVDGEQSTARMLDVPPGTYAFSAFQDMDGNGTFDIGSLGPNEPYGFSGPIQNGYPEYDLAAVDVMGNGARVEIELLPGSDSMDADGENRPVGASADPAPMPQNN